MSDDLDKFVLQYTVDLKDSVQRLERLAEKQNAVQKATKDATGEFKKFSADAAGELGKLVPGLSAVSSAVRAMGAEFAAATVALGALAVGVKMVLDLRQQYNQQRLEGMQLGVSPIRMEEYTRKFAKASGGYVTREGAVEGLKTFSGMANSAYQDPTRLGREARIMRMLGVNVGARGGNPTGLNQELVQLAEGLRGKSKSDVQGIAKATGMSQDWLLTVQKLGPSIGKVTEMTNEEIEKREKAESSLSRFNDELGKLKEKFVEISNELAEPLLPALTQLVRLMERIAAAIPQTVKEAGHKTEAVSDFLGGTEKGGKLLRPGFGLMSLLNGDYFAGKTGNKWGLAGMIGDFFGRPSAQAQQEKQAAQEAQKQQQASDDKRDAAVEKMDEANQMGIKTANEMSLAINMFAGAVQSFSSAVNIQQAWAAWAGEVGKANGLPGSSGAAGGPLTGGGSGKWTGNQYASQIDISAKKYGVDPQMLAAIMQVESHGINGQYSETGAGGLMQVTRGNWKAYGNGRDIMDPAANIDVGARIWKEMLVRNNGNVEAALRGYNGNSDPNYVSKIRKAYGGNSMGAGGVGIGESREKMNIRSVQSAIAGWLNVPLDQVQRGGVIRGDAAWAQSQMEAGIQNHIYELQKQLSVGGLPDQTYAKLRMELRDQSRGLELMKMYSQQVVDKQRPGDRLKTIGEMPIYININGAQNPQAVSEEVNRQLRKAMLDLLNQNSNGLKG